MLTPHDVNVLVMTQDIRPIHEKMKARQLKTRRWSRNQSVRWPKIIAPVPEVRRYIDMCGNVRVQHRGRRRLG